VQLQGGNDVDYPGGYQLVANAADAPLPCAPQDGRGSRRTLLVQTDMVTPPAYYTEASRKKAKSLAEVHG